MEIAAIRKTKFGGNNKKKDEKNSPNLMGVFNWNYEQSSVDPTIHELFLRHIFRSLMPKHFVHGIIKKIFAVVYGVHWWNSITAITLTRTHTLILLHSISF